VDDSRSYVTPAYPRQALNDAKAWKSGGKAVFARPFSQNDSPNAVPHCKNCVGSGQVWITFCADGPYQNNPSQFKASTWFDGDMINGKGWYKIEKTVPYVCPLCNGSGTAK